MKIQIVNLFNCKFFKKEKWEAKGKWVNQQEELNHSDDCEEWPIKNSDLNLKNGIEGLNL